MAPADSQHTSGSTPQPREQLGRANIGTFELAFFVVAAAGPLLVIAGYAPLAFMIGGVGAPGA